VRGEDGADERSRYVKNQFQPASTMSTVGASFLTKRVVDDESDTVVRLQIWDTAGQERFRFVPFFLSIPKL
jgi:GTPase SAR1 family protein